MVLQDGKLTPRVTCIGISGWARAGKDTIADHMVEQHGYLKMSLASPMKDALYALDPRITVNEVQSTSLRIGIDIYGWEGIKERSPHIRGLLQRLGTEVGREQWGEDFWVDMALDRIPDGAKVVFADVRFPNEANAIKELGGEVWRVERINSGAANEHISEHALDDYTFDHKILNYNGLQSLYATVDTILTGL
jgi:hypothetical protein